jgi:multiple sugar transport system substrate-binding protein
VKNKFAKLSLIAAVGLTLLAGCSKGSNTPAASSAAASGSSPAGTDEAVTIRVLSSDDFAGFRESMIPEFNKKYPNIKVELEHVAYDQLHDKELVSFNAGGSAAYDVVDVDEIWTAEYAEAAFVKPVTDRFTDEMKNGILDASKNIVTYNDKMYGVPMFNDVLFFYYNEEMLKAAGFTAPPKTWEEFTAQSKALQDKKITEGPASAWGWSMNEGLVVYFTQFLGSFGGKYFDDSGKPAFNDEKGVQALQYMVDVLKNGVVDKNSIASNDRQILDAFKNGKTAFVSGWSFYWGEINGDESKVKGKAKVGMLPAAAGANPQTGTGSMYLGITEQTKNEEAAWKYIEFMGSKEIQKQQSLKAGALPIWKDLYQDAELIKNHGAFEEMGKQLEYTISRPSLGEYNDFSKELQLRLQEALTGKSTPKEALDQAAQHASLQSK